MHRVGDLCEGYRYQICLRTLQWTEIQQEQLLNRLDLLRLENARLQDRVEELVRQVEGLKQQQPLF